MICFEKSGGSPEFVGTDCGFVVPYLDVGAMARRVVQVVNDPTLHAQLGQRAKTKVRECHDVEVVAPRIANIIDAVVAAH